ncbi:Ig domain-containing protein [Streptomyces sp. NRRL WC-3742]|uniref:Ig domain-containing protein n=1 Tax=Streptomyces sp. NRRL WC-3742 TaxID=1463934 RepID=UPI0007C4E090|nr:Ig domain-containing protein [Streptomyces sp. NRRL WC-3742]
MPSTPTAGTRAAVLGVVTALAVAGLTGLGRTPATAAAAAVGPDGSGGVVLDAGYLHLDLDATGQVTSLVDKRTAKEYVATGQGTAPLVSLMVDGRQVMPSALALDGGTLVFTGPGGFEVDVAVQDLTTYSTLTVTKATAPDGADLQTLLWGPLATNITQTLGESAGIVRDDDFALGMKPLTDRTEGGWPREELNTPIGWQNQVASNPMNVDDAHEQWSVGGRTPWGTVLRAFTFDYTRTRTRVTTGDGSTDVYPMPVGPLPNGQGSVVGSKIALFGTTPDLAPTVLSNLARGQGLPYPTINGQWQKSAQATSQSILVLSDLNTGNVGEAAKLAKAGGMSLIYKLGPQDGPWDSDGHYGFDSDFGNSDTAAKAMADEARAEGVRLGVHTLSDFVTPNDPYIQPPFSPDMALGLSTTLSRNLGPADTTLYLTSCAPLAKGPKGQRMLVGQEVVTYGGYTQAGGECQVTDVKRKAWDSASDAHQAGTPTARIPENEYGGALGGINIVNAVAGRFATVWNTTGIAATSFDGLESASESGWGAYGMARLVNETFRRQTSPDGFISETSREGSNIWDGISRASWGEANTGMDKLYLHNAYHRANYLPGMMGWITLEGGTKPKDLEDILARAASWNAGSGFRTSIGSLTDGPNTEVLLEAIKQWDTARDLGSFTPAQLASLRDQSTHWHLSVVTPGQSWSLQQLDANGNPTGPAQSVTAPTPAFTTTTLPTTSTGTLYEARVVTNTPQTIRYSVTSGELPAGLTLNPDTGGITGIPTTGTPATFTITGKGGLGTADAVQTFTISPTSPIS